MPKSTPHKIAYQEAYNAKPAQKALGVARRRERRHEIAAGKVAIGDGKDIAHKVAASQGGRTVPSNLKIESEAKNRGWRKASGYKVPKDS